MDNTTNAPVQETKPQSYAYSQYERETHINWFDGSKTMLIETYQRKWINKILKLAEMRPNDVIIKKRTEYMIEAELPIKYLRLQAPVILSDEQRAIATARLKAMKIKDAGTESATEKDDEVQEGIIVEAGTEAIAEPKSVYIDD